MPTLDAITLVGGKIPLDQFRLTIHNDTNVVFYYTGGYPSQTFLEIVSAQSATAIFHKNIIHNLSAINIFTTTLSFSKNSINVDINVLASNPATMVVKITDSDGNCNSITDSFDVLQHHGNLQFPGAISLVEITLTGYCRPPPPPLFSLRNRSS